MNVPLEETGKIVISSIKNKGNYVIIEYKKDKEVNKIKVLFDSTLNMSLKEGEVDASLIEDILKKDEEEKLRKYLVNLIIKKPYSEKELSYKGLNKVKDKEIVNKIIKLLKEDKLIDDEEYVLSYLEYFKANNYGKYYILNFFKEKGVANKFIEKIKFSNEEEKGKAYKYFEQIKNKFVSTNFIRQKKRIHDAMLARGFELSIINELIKTLNVDNKKEEELFLKDYKKAKAKYLKASDKEAKITNYLINRGFSYELIKNKLDEEKCDD